MMAPEVVSVTLWLMALAVIWWLGGEYGYRQTLRALQAGMTVRELGEAGSLTEVESETRELERAEREFRAALEQR